MALRAVLLSLLALALSCGKREEVSRAETTALDDIDVDAGAAPEGESAELDTPDEPTPPPSTEPAPPSDGEDASVPGGEGGDDTTTSPNAPGDNTGGGTDNGAFRSLRFIALGDAGKGNSGQYLVADAMAEVCEQRGGCDFALLLGDNIYDSGVASVDDEQWQEKFELPYAALEFPFYVTLGNHDLGGGGAGTSPKRGDYQVDYSAYSTKFHLPATHYRATETLVELVSLNTTSLFFDDIPLAPLYGYDDENEAQAQSLAEWNAAPVGPWRIAFGHHPYLSNGPHGNAGNYDGLFPGLPASGTGLKEFFDERVLGKFDAYLCGHDHSLQDMGTVNGTELFVSGGGASHTDLEGENPAVWQADRRGFLLVEVTDIQMGFTFFVVPDDGDPQTSWYQAHSRTISR